MYDPNPGVTNYDPLAHDTLIAGHNQKPITRDVTIVSGQTLVRGALLGKITASGKYNLSLVGAGDGSEVPVAILVVDTDASAGDLAAPIYEAGEFNEAAITFGTGHTVASVRDGLRDLGIHLKATQPAQPA